MANNERLTKRLKKIEDWVADNEVMGGPKGYLDTMVALYQNGRMLTGQVRELQNNFNTMRAYAFEFIEEHKLSEEWDEFIKEKNAVQEQQTEEVPVQEQAESGEEVSETPKQEKE
jgi:hypothetical protein